MLWNEKIKKRFTATGFLLLLFGGATFLAVTDNDEDPSLWRDGHTVVECLPGEAKFRSFKEVGSD